MRSRTLALAATFLTFVALSALPVRSQDEAQEEPPDFTEAYLHDEQALAAGAEIWHDQCRHCHGKSAYPGKAPKLRPKRYTPDFVFGRVTNGFRKMPAWKEIYTREERMAVTAYVLSPHFAP